MVVCSLFAALCGRSLFSVVDCLLLLCVIARERLLWFTVTVCRLCLLLCVVVCCSSSLFRAGCGPLPFDVCCVLLL